MESCLEIRHSGILHRRGQALIELTVFILLFFIVITGLVSYGIRYNVQQSLQMTAFRRAMYLASNRNLGSASYTISEDVYAPDFSSDIPVGSTTLVSASAQVTRDPRTDLVPADEASVSRTVMDIKRTRDVPTTNELWDRRVLSSAIFRSESIPSGSLDKYNLVYASVRDNGWILDSCLGQLTSYADCYVQARMIVDYNFCVVQCGRMMQSDCSATCSQTMNYPWYVQGWWVSNGVYHFPRLEQLFSFATSLDQAETGLQTVDRMDVRKDTSTRVAETGTFTRRQDDVNWAEYKHKDFYVLYADGSGGSVAQQDESFWADDVYVQTTETAK